MKGLMKSGAAVIGIGLLVALPWDIAAARGCVSGAAVGGVAGHVAGHHALLGAAAGCAINHHRDKVKDRQAAADARVNADAQRPRDNNGNAAVMPVAPGR